jgi:hypothetical protein
MPSRRAVLWATDYGQDDITWLMRWAIAEPLRKELASDPETQVHMKHLAGPDATRENLARALPSLSPAWIVTTSHGMTGPLGDKAAMGRDGPRSRPPC